MPNHIIDQDCTFTCTPTTKIICDASFLPEATVFASQVHEAIGLTLSVMESNMDATETDIFLRMDDQVVGNESYVLDIAPNAVTVRASSSDGIWWGLQDIRQMLLTSGAQIPCCSIQDAPRFEWRGVMLDCVRHFFTVDFIKKLIDIASMNHLNRFHWHLTDDQGWRLPVPEYPLLTSVGAYRTKLRQTWDNTYGDFYTEDQIREVVEYARQHHVVVVPEVETPGHALAMLTAYPSLGCTGGPYEVKDSWGIFDDVMCAGNDDVLKLLDAVMNQLVRLFPSPYIHIGGDECPRTRWKECPKCALRVKTEGLGSIDELQAWMTVRIAKMVQEHGKRPIGWDEVLDGTERLGLPHDMIIMSWRGLEGGTAAAHLGHDVIMCPTTDGCYLDHKNYDSPEEPGYLGVETVHKSFEFDPVPPGMALDVASHVIGGQGNLWTEKVSFSKQAEYMLFPRLCALAEGLWIQKDRKDFESFRLRMPALKERLDALHVNYYDGQLE